MILAGDHWPQTHLAPRSGESEGPGAERREGEGHAGYLLHLHTCKDFCQYTVHEILSSQDEKSNSATKRPLTFPLLRNGPLPLPASRGEVFGEGVVVLA